MFFLCFFFWLKGRVSKFLASPEKQRPIRQQTVIAATTALLTLAVAGAFAIAQSQWILDVFVPDMDLVMEQNVSIRDVSWDQVASLVVEDGESGDRGDLGKDVPRKEKAAEIQGRTGNSNDFARLGPQYVVNDTVPASQVEAAIVIQLSGELANNLQHISHGVALHLWAKEKFGLRTNVLLRHFEGANNRMPKPKWKSARRDIENCFVHLRRWNFTRINPPEKQRRRRRRLDADGGGGGGGGDDVQDEYTTRRLQQKKLLGIGTDDRLQGLVNSRNVSEIEEGLQLLKEISLQLKRNGYNASKYGGLIQIPHVISESLDAFPMIDRYYDEIRRLFEFDFSSPQCCSQLPASDEVAFHFRNYESEMPGTRAYDMGFAELSPKKTAREVFPNNVSVAIVSRFANKKAEAYVEALSGRSRLVVNQTGVQDFCFLASAKKEIVGHARSTFVTWAGLLGRYEPTMRLYHADNRGLRLRHGDNYLDRFTYNWTNPLLRSRVRFELYRSEEMEVLNKTV